MLKKIILLFLLSEVILASEFLIVQSTTSTADSGFYDYLLPIYEKKTGIDIRVVAVGTGQAIKNAENGDGDLLIVHSKEDENKFVKKGNFFIFYVKMTFLSSPIIVEFGFY